jgi:hypothetical protein
MGAEEEGEQRRERGIEEEREAMGAQGGGRRAAVLPPFRVVSFQRVCFRFFAFRTGAAYAAPVSLRFERGSTCCPVSFPFKQGQRVLPPFLFVSNRGSTCCPHFFRHRGQRMLQHGSTCCPVSFSLPPNNGGYLIFSVLINVQ